MKMKWCKCPKCGHKLFMIDEDRAQNNVYINIKCSSCKEIVDVEVYGDEVVRNVQRTESKA